MLIHKNIEFHNVAELKECEGTSGLRLYRFPEKVRNALGHNHFERGREISQASTGCEIRFTTTANTFTITLSATNTGGEIVVYFGDYFHSFLSLTHGLVQTFRIVRPDFFSKGVPTTIGISEKKRFSNDVVRLLISRGYSAESTMNVAFHNIETFGHKISPPAKENKPKLKWLAYGSSITHGSGATFNHNSYAQQAAHRLGVDLLNKGMGGSCLCEPEIARYLANEKDWDFATLELGVNMLYLFDTPTFEKRARYLIETIHKKNQKKPIVLITIYPNYFDLMNDKKHPQVVANREFREVLRKIKKESTAKNIFLIEGNDVLTDTSTLTTDLIHPSDSGHTIMGENLARLLGKVI